MVAKVTQDCGLPPFQVRRASIWVGTEPPLSLGTVNFGRDVFSNPWDLIVELHTQMQQRGIVPEYEVFDLGHLATLQRLNLITTDLQGGRRRCFRIHRTRDGWYYYLDGKMKVPSL